MFEGYLVLPGAHLVKLVIGTNWSRHMLISLYQALKHSFVELQLSNISVQSELERKLLIPAQFIYFDLKRRDMLAEGGLMKAVYSMKVREKWSLVLKGWRISKFCTAKSSLVRTRSRMFPVLGFNLLGLVTSFKIWQSACSFQNWRKISEQVGWVWLLSRVWLVQWIAGKLKSPVMRMVASTLHSCSRHVVSNCICLTASSKVSAEGGR